MRRADCSTSREKKGRATVCERLYGYGIGIVAGLATIAAVWVGYAGWFALLVVLVWAVRGRSEVEHD